MRILIFGNSITYGYWDRKGGWVTRLREWIDEKNIADPDFSCAVYNLGISGDTTKDLLKRFKPEAKARISAEEKTYLIFAIGINDSQYLHSKNGLKFSVEEFRNNLRRLIKKAYKISSEIVFLGLTPVDEERVDPVPWNKAKSFRNKYVRKFDEVIRGVCKQEKVDFIELYREFEKGNYKKMLEDGLHPNSEGHNKIFKIVKEFLIENNLVKSQLK